MSKKEKAFLYKQHVTHFKLKLYLINNMFYPNFLIILQKFLYHHKSDNSLPHLLRGFFFMINLLEKAYD